MEGKWRMLFTSRTTQHGIRDDDCETVFVATLTVSCSVGSVVGAGDAVLPAVQLRWRGRHRLWHGGPQGHQTSSQHAQAVDSNVDGEDHAFGSWTWCTVSCACVQ